jgi:hypothetical protein
MDVIDDVLTSYTLRGDSHRSSWPKMQRCMLADTGVDTMLSGGDLDALSNSDTWFVSHGMEFKDSYNLNSGWLPEHAERLRILIDKGADGSVISLERKMPDLVGLLKPRAEKSDNDLTSTEWSKLGDVLSNVPVLVHQNIGHHHTVVLGDSHSIARYKRGSLVLRNDGLTLYGMLQKGIRTMLTESGIDFCENLVIVAGNIDIRHHLLRQQNPIASLEEMMKDLWTQLDELTREGIIMEHEITMPYPIEFEGRKLPKTGYYKGTPFFGQREYRVAIAGKMMHEIVVRFPKVYHWPQRWYDMDPEQYATEFMEKPRSVHLSPRNHNWDYELNRASR